MFFVWALALSGLFLIYLEFFLPGAIMAIGGTVLLLSSVFMFHLVRPGATHLVVYLIALGFAVFVLVRFASWRIRLAAREKADLEGPKEHLYPKEMVGKKGKTATDLKPSGHIFIDDKTYQALSQNGFIDKGTDVTIVGGEGNHLIVETQPNTES